ncbi:DUF305 domain-containing protein [Amycolatopsis sp. BJA-103]|uniref:DUF305 domain-containing protein n=1 Tax=unclassified Amycolatopsis TaxID=2618356 RepID=UPI000C78E33D|nr:DUF305 domain-containing protein [Amycolatopsis sp. BJA-103]AUI57052.1 DUF305 domain-containing protein [Amycolatopsis sp. BJA-103]PNE15327.1 DUF305 domain-containing protein [Amycolatopsis sp. BJA-103]
MRKSLTSALLVAAFVVSGCTGDESPAEPASSAPVIIPGKPGEQAGTGSPGPVNRDQAGEADVEYMTMMIPHHQQAKVMTDLVPGKTANEQLKAIAGRISVAQDGEVAMMKTWLSDRGKPVPGEGHAGHGGGHDHGLMPGMATEAQLADLRAASGPAFEKLFLDLMIAHHQGALTMAETQLGKGVEIKAQEMAQEVITGQSAEIERMRTMRGKL